MTAASDFKAAAVQLAESGFYVFPLKPGSKHPAHVGWQAEATNNPREVRQIWNGTRYNIGIALWKSGHVVIDLDVKDGKDGIAALALLEREHGLMPDTPTSLTVSGCGRHCIAKFTGEPIPGSTSKVAPGIDVKCRGGYIVAPGSVVDGRKYQWLPGCPTGQDAPLLPEWLAERCRAVGRQYEEKGQQCYQPAEETIEDIASALAVIPNDDLPWDEWNRIGMAVWRASGGAEEGFLAFDDFSSKSVRYDADETRQRWWDISRCPPDSIGAGTLYHLAKEADPAWLSPSRQAAMAEEEGGTTAAPYKLLDIDEILNLPAPTWLIPDYLPADALSELFGDTNVGKTFLALDWALSLATGMPWLAHETQPIDVIYVYAESGIGLGKRSAAWLQSHQPAVKPRFRALPMPIDMTDARSRRRLVESIKAYEMSPGLIVIDTLAMCFGDNEENSTRDMSRFVNSCQALRAEFAKASVLIIHHTGKDQSRGARGAHALKGALDSEWCLKEIGKGPLLLLENPKMKDAEKTPPLCLKRETVELTAHYPGDSSCIIRAADPAEHAAAKAKAEEVKQTSRGRFETLDALVRVGLTEGASYDTWFAEAERAAQARGKSISEATFNRHRSALLKEGRAEKRGSSWFPIAFDD